MIQEREEKVIERYLRGRLGAPARRRASLRLESGTELGERGAAEARRDRVTERDWTCERGEKETNLNLRVFNPPWMAASCLTRASSFSLLSSSGSISRVPVSTSRLNETISLRKRERETEHENGRECSN